MMGIGSPDFNPLVAIDFETTGPDPTEHEIFEIHAIPISPSFDIDTRNYPMMLYIRPDMPETVDSGYARMPRFRYAMKHGSNSLQAMDVFHKWLSSFYYDRLILPLCWNYRDRLPFLREWMGEDVYDKHFSRDYRDLQEIARFISDRQLAQNKVNPFSRLTITALATYAGYSLFDNRPGAYERVKAMPILYRNILRRTIL